MYVLNQHEVESVSGGVNWKLITEGGIVFFAGVIATTVGTSAGPLGVPLVIVGSFAIMAGGTAIASGWGDASGVVNIKFNNGQTYTGTITPAPTKTGGGGNGIQIISPEGGGWVEEDDADQSQ